MAKTIPEEALQYIVERPAYLDHLIGRSAKIVKLAQTLKMIERTKSLCYDEVEFSKEFGSSSSYFGYLKKKLKALGITHPRVVRDQGKVWIWKNDS